MPARYPSGREDATGGRPLPIQRRRPPGARCRSPALGPEASRREPGVGVEACFACDVEIYPLHVPFSSQMPLQHSLSLEQSAPAGEQHMPGRRYRTPPRSNRWRSCKLRRARRTLLGWRMRPCPRRRRRRSSRCLRRMHRPRSRSLPGCRPTYRRSHCSKRPSWRSSPRRRRGRPRRLNLPRRPCRRRPRLPRLSTTAMPLPPEPATLLVPPSPELLLQAPKTISAVATNGTIQERMVIFLLRDASSPLGASFAKRPLSPRS